MPNATITPTQTISRHKNTGLLRRYYVLNRRLLFATLAVLVVVLPSAYFWYKHQLDKNSDALLLRAEQLEKEQDWSKATAYYQRYLLVRPDDTSTLVKMVEAYAKEQPTPRRVSRLTQMLYRTLGRAPERRDLRLMLAENLLKSGDLERAEKEAQTLTKVSGKVGIAARKVIALSKFSGSRGAGAETISTAVKELVSVVEELPEDVLLAIVAADALREHPTAIPTKGQDPATYADEIMDRLVASAPENVDALLARYRYRVRYKLPNQDRDLQSALKLAPDHVEALLLSAQVALAQDESEKSERALSLLRRAVDAAPEDPKAYLAIANISKRPQDNSQALKWLRKGLSQTNSHLEIGLALCSELLTAGETKEAARTLRKVELQSAELVVRMNTTARTLFENRLRLLQARLDLANDKPVKANTNLQAILLSTEANRSTKQSIEWAQATTMLARIASEAGHWDQATIHWGKLAQAFPRTASIIQSAAAAYLNAGDATSAIKTLDNYSRLADPTTDMLQQATQAHLVIQLSRPVSDRNWTEFLDVLDSAKANNVDRWQLVLAEVDYLLSEVLPQQTPNGNSANELTAKNHARAAKILQAAENSFGKEAAFWRRAAQAYQRLGLETDVQRAVDRYLVTEPSPSQHARLQVSLLSSTGKFDETEKLLVAMRPSLSDVERRQIDRLRIENWIAAKKPSEAQLLVKKLIEADSKDPKLLAMGIELSLGLGDIQTAQKWEKVLGTFESSKYVWRYLRSLRQIGYYNKLERPEKKELARSVSVLLRQRPRWYPVVALAARHAQLNGELAQALSRYRLAVKLGDQRPRTLEQLVSLLYQEDRLNEAEKYLDLLITDQSSSTARDSMAIKLALKQNRIGEALTLAKQGVERFPEQVMRHIWLANLLLRNQQPQEAVQILQQTAQRFPDDSRVWKGLFTLFVNTERSEDAHKTLAAMLASDSLPEGSRHFVAAQGFEILGDLSEAKQHYEQAVAMLPEKIAVRLRYAKLLLATDTVAARGQYEQVLRLAPDNSEGRRELAGLLAATGRDEDWNRVQGLLDRQTDDSQADSATNDRLRASLLLRKGRTRKQRLANCQSARKMLQRLIRTSGDQDSDVNRRLLASIYEQEAALTNDNSLLFAAREQLRYLVDKADPSHQNLTLYIQFLVRHANAEKANSRIEKTDRESENTNSKLREVFLADAEARLLDMKRERLNEGKMTPDSLAVVDLSVRLLQAQGQDDEAADYVAKWVSSHDYEDQDENAQAQLYLMTGKLYSRLGQHAEAEGWYRRLTSIAPHAYVMVVQALIDQDKQQEAAEFCLEMADGELGPEEAILLARIMVSTSQSSKPTLPEVQMAIEKTRAKHSDNLDLLQAEAVMRASQGEYDRAIASFRRMIEVDADNALAMNNLATLLAERPNQRSEALEYIDRAISVVGRVPALLDTQGTIFLKMDNPTKAIFCLEEATATGATDPRYYFHLAAAYELADRVEEAASSLLTARDYGLEKAVLTDDDRSLLARLERQLEMNQHSTGAN